MTMVMCPNTQCGGKFNIPDEYLGKKVVCNRCKTTFRVQSNNGVVAAKRDSLPLPMGLSKEELPNRRTVAKQEVRPLLDELPLEGNKKRAKRKTTGGPGRRSILLCSVRVAIFVVGLLIFISFFKSSYSEVYGCIEITSSEIRVHVYEFFPDSTLGFDFRRLSESPWREKFPLKVNKEGDFDPKALKETVAAIERLHKLIQEKHNVKSDKIVIVSGSRVFKDVQNKEKNRKLLDRLVHDATGRNVDFVENSEKELELQTGILIPEKLLERTVFIDLGNSGCRGGCPTKKGKPAYLDVTGVKAFTESMKKHAANGKATGGRSDKQMDIYIKAASELANGEFRATLIKALQDKENGELNGMLTGRRRIELVGGIPWVIATYKNPKGRDQTHTRLTVQQIEEFYSEVRRLRTYPEFQLPSDLPEDLRKKLNDDAEVMRTVIPPENLIAGTEMLRILMEELRFGDPGREIYFHNYGQEAIVLRFMQKMWEQTSKK